MRFLLFPAICAALPQNPELLQRIEKASKSEEMTPCNWKECQKPERKYELISKSQPGIQWRDHGGYCGSWSIQRAILAKGAWISQQQVRDHASPAPGAPKDHANEILSPNIDEALRNLKIRGNGFDYQNAQFPQQHEYFKWLKKQLVAGRTVVWMIMWDGEALPAYNLKLPAGLHGHVEPVIGIQSNRPLSDETVYDDDVAVHYDDVSTTTLYTTFGSLPGNWSGEGDSRAHCSQSRYCIGPYSYGWALHGFLDQREGWPLSLSINPWLKEPESREGGKPVNITGTLTATGLTQGSTYEIYRWGTTEEAFTYSGRYKIITFTATDDTFVYRDPRTFSSDSATYYRCVKADVDGFIVWE